MREPALPVFADAATAGAFATGLPQGPTPADAAPASRPAGRSLGTSRLVGVSTDAEPRTAEPLTFVCEPPDGKITTSGRARLSASGPVFDERFALTGGTGAYENATGRMRVLREAEEQARVTFTIQH